MKVMVVVKASKGSEAGELPSTELLAAMGKFNESLAKAGILLDAAGLKPSSRGARVRFSGSQRIVMDGPFSETKELIAGYWVWKVKSLQEAIEWVKKCPNPMNEDSDIEIRPFYEADDLGEAFTPELREQDAAVLATTLGLIAPHFKNQPALIVAGRNESYTMETRSGIPQQWQSFKPLVAGIPGRIGESFYGVCWNTKPNCAFDYLSGVEVSRADPLPATWTGLKLDARRYVVFAHRGNVADFPKLIDTVWGKWAPNCGLKISKAPCVEHYTPGFNGAAGNGGMELWVPLES